MINAIFDEKELGPYQYPQLYWVQNFGGRKPHSFGDHSRTFENYEKFKKLINS